MNLFQVPALKVGVLVSVVAGLVAVMTIKVSEDPGYFGRARKHWFMLNDASGLVKNSSVKLAGINVGVVKEITLDKGRARLVLSLDPNVEVSRRAKIVIKNTGILGDRYVEVQPGPPGDELLEDGAEIAAVQTQGSMESVMDEVGKLSNALVGLADTLKDAAKGEGDRATPIAKIIDNLENITADLSEVSRDSKGKFKEIVDNVHQASATLSELINDDTPEGFKKSWSKATAGLARLDRTLANIEEISDKINTGKGTIGKLVNDEKTVDELNTAIGGVNKFLGEASKLQTSIDFHSEYLAQHALYKSYLGVRIKPGLDRYYDLQIVDDPRGVVEKTETRLTSNPGTPSETTATTAESKTFRNKIKFTALFAKNFWDFTVKGGLIESSGGAGVDYHFYRRRARLSFEAFDFSNSAVHLRTSARYNVTRGIYVVGGADDFASRQGLFSTYFGAGLDVTNDDLKFLFSRVSF